MQTDWQRGPPAGVGMPVSPSVAPAHHSSFCVLTSLAGIEIASRTSANQALVSSDHVGGSRTLFKEDPIVPIGCPCVFIQYCPLPKL